MRSFSPTSGKVTIHEVAAAAGVSIKTVSRVLRDEPRVAQATRDAVRAAIRQLDYVPHPSATNLASSVPKVMGLVSLGVREFTTSRSGFEYRMCLQSGVLTACEAMGYGLRIVRLPEGDAPVQVLLDAIRRHEVGGYVIPSPSCQLPGLLDALDAADVCYSAIGSDKRPADNLGLAQVVGHAGATVSADDRAAMRAMVSHVIQAGHRRIGFVRGNKGWHDTEERHAGYLDALSSAGLPIDPALVAQGEFNFDAGRECARQLLALPHPPSAIVCSSDDIAAAVIAVAHELGLELPRQLSVTGYDNLELARKVWPSLSTVHQPVEKMAEIAARQVIAQLEPRRAGMVAPPMQVMVHSELVQRDSVAPPALA